MTQQQQPAEGDKRYRFVLDRGTERYCLCKVIDGGTGLHVMASMDRSLVAMADFDSRYWKPFFDAAMKEGVEAVFALLQPAKQVVLHAN